MGELLSPTHLPPQEFYNHRVRQPSVELERGRLLYPAKQVLWRHELFGRSHGPVLYASYKRPTYQGNWIVVAQPRSQNPSHPLSRHQHHPLGRTTVAFLVASYHGNRQAIKG